MRNESFWQRFWCRLHALERLRQVLTQNNKDNVTQLPDCLINVNMTKGFFELSRNKTYIAGIVGKEWYLCGLNIYIQSKKNMLINFVTTVIFCFHTEIIRSTPHNNIAMVLLLSTAYICLDSYISLLYPLT